MPGHVKQLVVPLYGTYFYLHLIPNFYWSWKSIDISFPSFIFPCIEFSPTPS
jgi:hypothetical protein